MSLSHRKLAAWYHSLGQQLEAGLTFADALRLSQGSGPPPQILNTMARRVEAGGSIDDALKDARGSLPHADRMFLAAGAVAGRMPRTLQALSLRHAQLGAAKLRVYLACLYPAAILHLGLLLLPITRMIDWEKGFIWDAGSYIQGVAVTLIPLWMVAAAVAIMIRRESPLIARLSQGIPIVRNYLRAQSLSEFCFGLGNLLEAGVPIDRAWKAAAKVTRSPQIKAAADVIAPVIARGDPPGPQLAATKTFPPEFIALYRSGEISGQLDQNLLRLSAQTQEQAQRALSLATIVYPGLMLLCVAAGVGYFVITVYGGYLKMLTGMTEP